MSNVLEDKLKILAEDELMLKAIKFAFDKVIEESKPDLGKTDNDELLGQKYRSYIAAQNILNQAMIDIESYKEGRTNSEKINKGK